MHYNYVYFNSHYGTLREDEPCGYSAICLKDTEQIENFTLVACPLDYARYPIRWLFSLCNSSRIPGFMRNMSRKIWYPFYFKDDLPADKPVCFVVGNSFISMKYIRYLRKKYQSCRVVCVRRDLIKTSNPEYSLERMKENFDIIFSYDKNDSEKYGLSHFHEIESKLSLNISSNTHKYDVFFAGLAKDRLQRLLTAYKIFTRSGLKCNFYLVGVPIEQRIHLDGVEYADHLMPYTEMIQRSIDAHCMLEINQSGACGYTSRFLEAVMYNKKLISDNISLKEDQFYDPQYIQLVNTIEEIDPSFVLDGWDKVDYHYDGEFSPVHLIYQIDRELEELDRKEDEGIGASNNS